ncbi:GNAT family N-acetyltransferase [Microlunatus sp. Gsoil 973]|uniref:GNAT family N-acetyltransferase n=1 Tax=Microlunatus sp. Gsoil 973 TaxID=2672569 RepID=UPI0012B50217|nr:GNAT family N-acetyltransferase [Microlunatus sp. Gsoil 973]QGN32794.1 GNAT family N-acetyltransferase [Microlunatus sp. Gsoil 973]
MKIEILDKAAVAAAGLDVPDIYYLPQYGSTAELIDGGQWECAVAEGGTFFFPYIRRSIPIATGEWDLVSPYGYGGPISREDGGLARFRRAFLDDARNRGCVAEFLRTNPLDFAERDMSALHVARWRPHATFAVNVVDGVEAYWEHCAGRHRTAVRKSVKSGVSVREVAAYALLDSDSAFRQLYRDTMDRVGATARLKLTDEYFEALVSGLSDHVSVIEAATSDKVLAAAVFMRWGRRIHYHLSGSSPDGMRLGATNAVLDYAVRELLPADGVLHLGGGVSGGDGLETFKRSIANRQLSVFLCSTVVDEGRYDELVREFDADPDSSYFPAYRA